MANTHINHCPTYFADPPDIDMYFTRLEGDKLLTFSKRDTGKNETANRMLNRNAVTKSGTGQMTAETATLRTSDCITQANKSRCQKVILIHCIGSLRKYVCLQRTLICSTISRLYACPHAHTHKQPPGSYPIMSNLTRKVHVTTTLIIHYLLHSGIAGFLLP
jgi:hypothetical protein